MISITAKATAQPTELTTYVTPSSPGAAASRISALPTTTLNGTQAANDLETVTKSGTTSKCSIANNLPVRPNPVWISSATKTIPCSLQKSLTAWTNFFGGMIKPPSPWTGSITTQATISGATTDTKKSLKS